MWKEAFVAELRQYPAFRLERCRKTK